jgi:elongation factor G
VRAYKPEEKRVVGFFGHRHSGKTSLIEGALFNAGVTTRLGSVEQGNLLLESDAEALSRQTTMHANVGFLEWKDCRIHVIDTPGDANFWGSTQRALAVIDAAVVMVSAVDGLEPVTFRVVQALQERRIPYAVFLSKLDKEGNNYKQTIDEVKAELAKNVALVTIPIGLGPQFKGVASAVNRRGYFIDGEKAREGDVPDDMTDEVNAAREALVDAVAAADDTLMEKYLEEGSLGEEELAQGLKAAFIRGDLVPVLVGAPTSNVGTRALLDLICSAFPSPLERPALKGKKNLRTEELAERRPEPTGGLVAQVFRTHYDPFAGTLSYARVFAGSIHASADVYNATQESADRPSHIYIPQGGTKNGVETKEATTGDIVALTKLKSTATGDTLSSKDDPFCLPPFAEPEALLNFGIAPANSKEEDKLSQYLAKLLEEDPSLRFERDPETKEMLLGGLGQAHIDYVVDRLKRMGIGVELKEPKVAYRETIKTAIRDIEGKHKKQSGGHGQFGVGFIHVEPLPRGSGFEFVDAIVGGAIPRQFIGSVEKGIRESLKKGPLSGHPIVDIRVTLYDGKYHRVDSSDMAFQIAGRKGMKAAFTSPKAKPAILEPYMELDISCPADMVGDVMGDLNSRRGRVNNMVTEGRRGKINASVPMNEVLRYANVLKSLTSGQGSFTMKFDRYEEAPPNVQQQVMASYKAEDEED